MSIFILPPIKQQVYIALQSNHSLSLFQPLFSCWEKSLLAWKQEEEHHFITALSTQVLIKVGKVLVLPLCWGSSWPDNCWAYHFPVCP